MTKVVAKLQEMIKDKLFNYRSLDTDRESKRERHAVGYYRKMESMVNSEVSKNQWPKFRLADLLLDMGIVLHPDRGDLNTQIAYVKKELWP